MRTHAFCAMQSADWTDPIGASSGQLFRTRDEGGEWVCLPVFLRLFIR
jgi:hypothetical protein